MKLETVKVVSKKDLDKFISFANSLYKDNPFWVSPLKKEQINFFDKDKNPFFEHSKAQLFYVQDENKKILGRISAHTNRMHNNFHNDNKGFFGFFECVNDYNVAKLLLDSASNWLKENNCNIISGPFNFTTNDECGMLIEGFESSPFIMMPHNFQYYSNLFEDYGFQKAMDLNCWLLESDTMPDFLQSVGNKLSKNTSLNVRCLNKKNLKKDIETVFEIYQKAWEKNWGFVPMTKNEFDNTVKHLLPVVNPDLVFIAEYDNQPAGFSVALPNYNEILIKLKGKLNLSSIIKILYYKNKLKSLRVITMGVIKEFQGKGIDSLFYYHTWKKGMELGFHKGEFSWVLETNTMMNKIAKHLGAHIHKKYRIYEKDI